MTEDITKALGIEVKKTGLIIAIRPDPQMLEKFKSGELKGFSIGGPPTSERDCGRCRVRY